MERLLRVLAFANGKVLTLEEVSDSLDISSKTLRKYLVSWKAASLSVVCSPIS
jgi:response regulator of citrate/malate metabolism